MKPRYFLVLLILFFPLTARAANIGFVNSSGVSFSTDPPFAGTMVKAYAVVINNVYRHLTATVAFRDNGQEFARTAVDVGQEEARQVSVQWMPTEGNHTVVAQFVAATVIDINGNTKQLSQSELDSLAAPISRTAQVDNDSDHDGIGDHDEISTYGTSPLKFDTDNDGLGDKEEIFTYKTNPNNPNTDGDNMNDGDEVHTGRNPLVKDDPLPPPPPPAPVVVAPVQPTPEPQQPTPAPKPKTTTSQSSNTETVQKKKTEPVRGAPTITSSATSTIETISNASATTSTTSSAPVVPAAARINPMVETSDDNGNWITVLGVFAALLGAAALVTGALAWREKNRY